MLEQEKWEENRMVPKCTWETNPSDHDEGWSHTLDAYIRCGGTNICGFDFACHDCEPGDAGSCILCEYAEMYAD